MFFFVLFFQDTRCYRLIRIEDLEDAARHQDLPSRLSPETQHVSSVQSSASASANVHILETPVIEAVAAVAAAPAAAPGGGVGSLQSEAGAETPPLTTSHRGLSVFIVIFREIRRLVAKIGLN